MNDVAIIVPFDNNNHDIIEFLYTLYYNTNNSLYKLFLINCGARTSGSAAIIYKAYELYHNDFIYTNEQNKSYWDAVIVGAQKAIDCGYKYICVLDYHIILNKNWLDILYTTYKPNRILGTALTGVCTSQSLDIYDNNRLIDYKQLSKQQIHSIAKNLEGRYNRSNILFPSELDDVCLFMDASIANLILMKYNDHFNINKFAKENNIKRYYSPRVFIWYYGRE